MGHSGVGPVTGAGVYKGRVGVAGVGVVGVVVRVAVGSNVEVGFGVDDGGAVVGEVGVTSGIGVTIDIITGGTGVGDVRIVSCVGVTVGTITGGDGVGVDTCRSPPPDKTRAKTISTATAANAAASFLQSSFG